MLKLRRGVVVSESPLEVEIGGEVRAAWADTGLLGELTRGDEVVVNVEAIDLGLGSGGFDIVVANLSRGMDAAGSAGAHVMKLNYTPIQHPVEPVERAIGDGEAAAAGAPEPQRGAEVPVLVLPLHGHLAPAAWAAARAAPGLSVGYVQTAGGALPGGISRDVAQLRGLGLLCGHVTAAPAFGGEMEALSVVGALDAAANRLRWDAVITGPGPGIIGSATHLGHGGMAALDSAHGALSLGMPTLLSPRLSEADPRTRHRGVSHHTRAVLGLLLAGVEVAAPAEREEFVGLLREVAGERHRVRPEPVALEEYEGSGLPTRTMGRELFEDRIFFESALAAGARLAALAGGEPGGEAGE
ncbi:MAG: DUF3866 family protein [Solirubrobacterales bacterium]